MPFVLAHPAAVLPLRRFCPRFLSFPALVAGTLSPDAGYLFSRYHLEHFAHHFSGSFGFALPAGLLLLAVFAALRGPAVRLLSEGHRKAWLPIAQQPLGSPLVILVSVLIGAWTHVFLDGATHKDGWLVEQAPVLETIVGMAGGHYIRICRLLWYACSFLGVAWICLAYGNWKTKAAGAPHETSGRIRGALVVALLFLGVAVVHHLVRGFAGNLAVAISSLVLVLGAVLKLGVNPPPAAQPMAGKAQLEQVNVEKPHS